MQGYKRPLPLPEAAAAAAAGGQLSRPRKRWRTVVLAMREEMCLGDVFGRRETGTVSFGRLLQVRLVSMVQRVVSEEVRRALAILHAPPRLIPSEENHPKFELRFLDKVSQPVYTHFKVERQNSPSGQDTGLRVAIYLNNQIITQGPLTYAEIEVSILPGDFCQNGQDNWTQKDFENAALVDREKMPPVLRVKHTVKLSMGVATIDWLTFGDNSSWTRSKMFRIGIRVLNCEGVRVKEGITEPFAVQDRRMEGCKKHYPPVSSDEIWRLKGIGKNGDPCKSLNGKGIRTVKDLLDYYYRDEAGLRNILGGMSETSKGWKTIIGHAKTCADYNGALNQPDELSEIRRNCNTLVTCNGTYLHGSTSSQHQLCENQIIDRSNEIITGLLRQISPFEGHNTGTSLNNEVYHNMVDNTILYDNEFQTGYNTLSNMGLPQQGSMDGQINAAHPNWDQISVMAANNSTFSVSPPEEGLHGGIRNQDLFDICSVAFAHMPERNVPLETTVEPCVVGSSSSVPNPSENNLIKRVTGLQTEIPEGPDLEDLLANTELCPNNYSELQPTSRSNSFNAGSCDALVKGFLASMSNSGNVNSLTPRRKVKTIFMVAFLASPRKKARRIVPPANQALQLSC